jgi:phosphate transport system substrate-binding protein
MVRCIREPCGTGTPPRGDAREGVNAVQGRWSARMPALWLLALLLTSACGARAPGLQIAGSTSVQPVAEVLAEAFARAGGPRVRIQGGGSTAGVQAVLTGVAGLGAISRSLTPAERAQGLTEHVIAYDVLTVVVHPDNPVAGLTGVELRALFAGEVRDWRQIGGRPGAVHLVSREAGSGSREAFRSLVGPVSPRAIIQNSAGAIRTAVMYDPQAIGYVSLGVAQLGGVKPLLIDGRRPGGTGYPLVRPLSLVSRGRPVGAAAAFIRFAGSPEGRRLIQAEGLLPGSAVEATKRQEVRRPDADP